MNMHIYGSLSGVENMIVGDKSNFSCYKTGKINSLEPNTFNFKSIFIQDGGAMHLRNTKANLTAAKSIAIGGRLKSLNSSLNIWGSSRLNAETLLVHETGVINGVGKGGQFYKGSDDRRFFGASHGGSGGISRGLHYKPNGKTISEWFNTYRGDHMPGYGDFMYPVDVGSAAINRDNGDSYGMHGGAAVQIYATKEIEVNGEIRMDGSPNYLCTDVPTYKCTMVNNGGYYSGSSGGSVLLTTPVLKGNGVISANGASGGDHSGSEGRAGGGGGRIAVYGKEKKFTGHLEAFGGYNEDVEKTIGGQYWQFADTREYRRSSGGAGTIYENWNSTTRLTINNNGTKGVTKCTDASTACRNGMGRVQFNGHLKRRLGWL
jgi:hypothetical protein